MKSKLTALMMVSLLLVACSLPSALSALLQQFRPQPTAVVESNSLLDLVENGRLSVVSIRGNVGLGSFTSRTIDLELFNNTNGELEVSIPCGLVFVSADENTSRMMVVQPTLTSLHQGETAVIRPFVLSIDALESLPSPERTYRVTELEAGKNRQFATCLCGQDLPAETETKDLISLQLAAWMVGSEGTLINASDSLNNLIKDLTGLPIAIPGLDDAMQDIAGNIAPNAQAWLDKCGITIGD